jgi:hypothetical protein
MRRGANGLIRARRHTTMIIPILMLRAKLNKTNSKAGMISHLFTQLQLKPCVGCFNGKFSYGAGFLERFPQCRKR